MQSLPIKSWAEDDRPREKLLKKGATALSNAEILAIIIQNGTREHSAVDVAKMLLGKVGNSLVKLSTLSVKDIVQLKVKGIGEVKAISIVAALELLNRKSREQSAAEFIKSSTDAAAFFKSQLAQYQHEVFAVIYLNQKNKILGFEIISEGGITSTIVDPRILFKKTLAHNAVSIVLAHNHPGGSVQPSSFDIELTKKLKNGAAQLEISILDHIIVTTDKHFSFADEGLL